jgi:phosphoribosylamine--glycine ligase
VACLEHGRLGDSGRRVVVEEFLAGEEASVMAVCDGEHFVLLPAARDYKRAFDGDRGPNTGGMGAAAPAVAVDLTVEREVGARIVAPVLGEMAARGTPYRGTLYCGIMIGARGVQVVEFNARFGDPETQVILPLVTGGFAELLDGAARGRLEAACIGRAPGAAVTVALVSENYPARPVPGATIEGLDRVAAIPGVTVEGAALARAGNGWSVTGGRAAYVTAVGESLADARARAYRAIALLAGTGWRCRHDIAGGEAAPRATAMAQPEGAAERS